MRDGVHVDLTKFSRELKGTERAFATATRKRVRTAITGSGSRLVSRVKGNASWSSRIPGAVKLQTSFSTRNSTVKIVVDAKKAPHARPLENGTPKSGAGVLRHPVYDSAHPATRWASMATRPFFFPAASAEAPVVQKDMENALDLIARDAGFH